VVGLHDFLLLGDVARNRRTGWIIEGNNTFVKSISW
jgi:hypothetical protein